MLKPNGRMQPTVKPYCNNPVMQVIDLQRHVSLIDRSLPDLKEIITAHSENTADIDMIMFAVDVFSLGVIYGKCEERRKRKERQAAV